MAKHKTIYGFDEDTGKTLARMARGIAGASAAANGLMPRPVGATTVTWLAQVTENVTAATINNIGDGVDETVTYGTGTVRLCYVNDDGDSQAHDANGEDMLFEAVKNPFGIPCFVGDVVSVTRDLKGSLLISCLGIGWSHILCKGAVTAATGTTPGSATCDLYDVDDSGNFYDTGLSVTVYNPFSEATTAGNMLVAVNIRGKYFVIGEDC